MHFIILQCDEIFGIIEDDADISRWRSILSAGKVYHISGLSVDAATDGERNVVTNLYKLVFTPRTTLLGVIEECQDISYQHRSPFLSFIDIPRRLRTPDNVVGMYCSHNQVCYLNLCMYFLCILYSVLNPRCSIDIIWMVVAIYHLERTRDRGTARRELLLCDVQYVLFSDKDLFIWIIIFQSYKDQYI